MHGRPAVGGRDPDGGVLARGGGAADQERQLEPAALHLLRDVDHLVERGRDQAREADGVAPSATAVSRIVSPGTITPRSITS